VVAQAFHWFDGARALAEIHRVLKPKGKLALIWNVRDERVDWIAQLTAIVDAHEADVPRYRSGRWREAFDQTDLFGPLERHQFDHVHQGTPQMVLDRVSSISFIAALPQSDKSLVLAQVRDLLATHPQTKDQQEIAFPYRTDVFCCSRSD
jgi:SAM-dependent methyltransferase